MTKRFLLVYGIGRQLPEITEMTEIFSFWFPSISVIFVIFTGNSYKIPLFYLKLSNMTEISGKLTEIIFPTVPTYGLHPPRHRT